MSESRAPDAHPNLLKQAGPNLGFAPPRGSESPRRGMFASLAHRQYRCYWTGLFLSNGGTWMQSVAQGWLVLRLSNSAVALGLVGFAGSIPTLLLGAAAGRGRKPSRPPQAAALDPGDADDALPSSAA